MDASYINQRNSLYVIILRHKHKSYIKTNRSYTGIPGIHYDHIHIRKQID